MKKIITTALAFVALGAMAQETYEGAQIATQELNGTAKYVGMGGAMEALGADISTINTNPAGIGLFRKSWIGASAGFTSQSSSYTKNAGITTDLGSSSKTNADLNQLGFVISTKAGSNSMINFAFNYQKSRNFNQIMQAVNTLNDASANKVNYIKNYNYEQSYTLQDQLTENVVNNNLRLESDGEDDYFFRPAEYYAGKYDNKGYISNFDFNISGNINNRVYLGATLGIKDVRYRGTNIYDELLENNDYDGLYGFTDNRRITGTGVDLKLGAIFRPIENSPFRFGVYINTPTWYDLNCYGNMSTAAEFSLYDAVNDKTYDYNYNNNSAAYHYDYKYCISTPWRFGASVGHTFGKIAAVGVTYEYADYSAIKNRIVEGTYYYYGEETLETSKDHQMNANNDISLKGVSLLKIGAEIKPIPQLAVRLGYNYQSAIYKDSGYKDITIDSDPGYGSVGAYYSTYDFVNWEATHRLTFGLGFNIDKHWGIDLAYQYATQDGKYYPFTSVDLGTSSNSGDEDINIGEGTKITNNRHQFNLSLGYRF